MQIRKAGLNNPCSNFSFFLFVMPCGLWDLSSLTRDQTPALKLLNPKHWATREFPTLTFQGVTNGHILALRLPEEREGKKCHVSWLLIHSRTGLCEIMARGGVRIFGKPLGVSTQQGNQHPM